MKKIDFRTLSSNKRYRFRKRAIAWIKSGKKKKYITELFGVRENTVSNWNKAYKTHGTKGLKDKRKGPKSEDMKLQARNVFLVL